MNQTTLIKQGIEKESAKSFQKISGLISQAKKITIEIIQEVKKIPVEDLETYTRIYPEQKAFYKQMSEIAQGFVSIELYGKFSAGSRKLRTLGIQGHLSVEDQNSLIKEGVGLFSYGENGKKYWDFVPIELLTSEQIAQIWDDNGKARGKMAQKRYLDEILATKGTIRGNYSSYLL